MRALTLETKLAQLGARVQVEVGPVGFVVYGDSVPIVAFAGGKLTEWARLLDDAAHVDRVAIDADEAPASRFVTTVHFSWDRVPARAA